jgi:hypothetical protein
MSDADTQPVPKSHPVSDPNNEPVKFVTTLGNFGCINGVVNLTLMTARYIPYAFPAEAHPHLIIAALLRMDLRCAIEVRDALHQLIEDNTTEPAVQ